jgi:hypothetical protein
VGAELLHSDGWMDIWTDGRTDRHCEATVTFCNFANAPKNKGIGQGKTVSEHIMKGHGEVEVLSLWKPSHYVYHLINYTYSI